MVRTDWGLTDPMIILGLNKQRFLQIHVIMYCNPCWKDTSFSRTNLRPGLAMMIATLRHPRSSSLPLDNSLSQPFSSHSISDVAKGVTLSPQHHGNTLQPCTLGPQGPGKVEECGKHSGCATWPDGWIKWQLEDTHTCASTHSHTHTQIHVQTFNTLCLAKYYLT